MAVRLYPHNQSLELLERLANVPPGTYQRLMAVRQRYSQRNDPGLEGYEDSRQYYAEIFADPDINTLDSQLVFGWGRLTPKAEQLAGQFTSPDFGSIHDPQQVRLLLKAQGVELRDVAVTELGGLCWG
ncbi:MAG: hypothetical protein JW862_04975 [Anaerolineales bacterium]|nr:hypothetical protein [Anaerolineales bacterium]